MTQAEVKRLCKELRGLPFDLDLSIGKIGKRMADELADFVEDGKCFNRKVPPFPTPSNVFPYTFGRDKDLDYVWFSWLAYRKEERRKPVTDKQALRQLKKLEIYGKEAWVSAINRAMDSGWIGFFPEKESSSIQGKDQSDKWSRFIPTPQTKTDFVDYKTGTGMDNKEYLNYIREMERS